MDKFSELKAAAMAATPGPWAAELTDVWVMSDGTADFMLADIFGDNDLSPEQDCANAAFIAAANPAAVLELLGERDADKKRIAELEAIRSAAEKLVRCKGRYHSEQNYRALAALFGVTTPDLPPVEGDSEAVIAELRAKLATPVRLPALLRPERDAVCGMIFANGRNEAIAECSVAIRQAGFLSEASPMTAEGEE